MIINADSLLPHLKDKVRPTQSDGSRHLICPDCASRTRLNTLADGRRKCTVCGKKFRIHKVTEGNKLKQCAEILLCFCIDFSPQRTAQITNHRYRLVALYNDHFRRLIAEKNPPHTGIALPHSNAADIHTLRDASRCRWCKGKIRSSDAAEKSPVFGVRLNDKGDIAIDPFSDDETAAHCAAFGLQHDVLKRHSGYAGFICCGAFHRFKTDDRAQDGSEQLRSWIDEWVRSHTGIWKRNTAVYLKELEWKYNHRVLHPDLQAQEIIGLMPVNFLTSWLKKAQESGTVQTSV